MAFVNRGNPNGGPYDKRAPGIDSEPPAGSIQAQPRRKDVIFAPSMLTGAKTLEVGGLTFHLPADSVVKRKGVLAWVLTGGLVHVLSSQGEIVISDADQARFARSWARI